VTWQILLMRQDVRLDQNQNLVRDLAKAKPLDEKGEPQICPNTDHFMHDERHTHVGDAHVVRSSHVLVFSCRLCFDSRSLAMAWLAGFAILEAPVELALNLSFWQDRPSGNARPRRPHLPKCDINPVLLGCYVPVAECSLQNFYPFEHHELGQ
jgi:hypothetical protein